MQNKSYYISPIGILEIITKDDALISLKTSKNKALKNEENELTLDIKKQLDEYFNRKRTVFDIKLNLKGTDFRLKVWDELQKIPFGKTRSYKDIAEAVGNKNASRAVGGACNKNPVLIIIPCHRVISKSGNLTGFACGTEAKKKLLNIENLSYT